jgi:hypothetical protein
MNRYAGHVKWVIFGGRMEYQERLTCFIDLLGFKAAIDQSLKEDELRLRFFEIFEEFRGAGLEKLMYGSIPCLTDTGLISLAEANEDDILQYDGDYDLVITQFSDSFVISAPVSNPVSCEMLFRSLAIIKMQFFFNVGMLMRGGMTIGKLVHKRGGALFGPAMNEAYEIESTLASCPRVVVSEKAYDFLNDIFIDMAYEKIAGKSSDGFFAFDLISIFLKWGYYRKQRTMIHNQLMVVEKDILKRSPEAHPKIAYLLHQWSLQKDKFRDELPSEKLK